MSERVSRFPCPSCRRPLRIGKSVRSGQKIICPRCGAEFRIEDEVTPKPPSPALPADTGADRPSATPSPGSLPPPPPNQPYVPGYTILGELGRGAWGVVYKARHEKLKRVVALKMVLLAPAPGGAELARFTGEAETVARLHHPNVVQIYEIGEESGRPYLALEFVGGGTLKRHLDGQPQPSRAAAELVEILAHAVHAAHARGIVHRDLKPANILLDSPHSSEDEPADDHAEAIRVYGVPKIADFGLAKRLDQDGGSTRRGEVLGTPLYMAPEQAKGRTEEVGRSSDVYALGAILYEMLTGRPPFEAETVLEILRLVETEPPVPPRRLRRQVPRDLETICLKCLEKNPRNRYASALALAEDLRHHLNGEPTWARPAGPLGQVWRWCLGNPVPASLLLTVTVILSAGVWQLSRLRDAIVNTTALEGARQQARTLEAAWDFYQTDVTDRVKGSDVHVSHDYKFDKKAIPIPATFTIELGETITRKHRTTDGMQVHLYSGYPFKWRREEDRGPQDDFEKTAWDKLKDGKLPEYSEPYQFEGRRMLRYALPKRLNSTCAACHNDHVKKGNVIDAETGLPRTEDWGDKDVRGVLEIVLPLDREVKETDDKLRQTYWLLGGSAAVLLALCGFVLAVGRRRRWS